MAGMGDLGMLSSASIADLSKLNRRMSLIPDVVAQRANLLHLGDCYNADTARYASWKEFLHAARKQNTDKAKDVLAALTTAEALWGRPGPKKMEKIQKAIEHGMWKVCISQCRCL